MQSLDLEGSRELRHAPEFLRAGIWCKIAPVHANEAQHSRMLRRLELVRESKLYRLLPGKKVSSRLEASGVALASDQTALVVFDNLNQIARIDLSLKRRRTNGLHPAPSLGVGFEDITIDDRDGRAFCLIEALEDSDGLLRGFVAEYDPAGHFVRCTRLYSTFEKENKGYEGLEHVWRGRREFLYALREGNHGKGVSHSGGRVDVFARTRSGAWEGVNSIRLPKQADFEDYAALTYRFQQIAVVSQASARLWVARIDEKSRSVVPGSDAIYRFPSKRYGNVEGIAWLTPDTLVAVSDRTSANQSTRFAKKDQSIHVFRIPTKHGNSPGSN
jgi:hypothetical protein